MSRNILLIAILYVSLCDTVFAQAKTELTLSIDDLFILIEQNNTDVEVARRAIKLSEQNENTVTASRLPDITASLSLSYLGDATISSRDFSNAMRAEMPHFGNTLDVTAYQPLYTGGAISGSIALARTRTKMTRLNAQQTIATTRFNAIEFYLNLFKYRNLLDVYKNNIALTEKLIDNMKVKKEQGVVLNNDITRYELKLSTLRYDSTAIANNIHIMNHNLTNYLGISDETTIIPKQSILSDNLPLENIDYWKNLANTNSLSIKQVNTEYRLAQQNDKIVKSQYFPRIGLVAGNTFNGPITVEIPPINKNLNYWWVGLNISYNISSLFKTNKETKHSRLNLFLLEEKQEATANALDRNVERVHTQYIQAHEQLDMQKKNVELATENYRIVNHRFNNQLALLTDMLDASTSKLDAEIRLINAHISTIYFYYQLKFISGTL